MTVVPEDSHTHRNM